MIGQYHYGTGRRKSAVARVFIKPGKGDFIVNDRPANEYFARETGQMVVRQPLVLTDKLNQFDVMVNVSGGGEFGQAGAVRHGLTRALIEFDPALKPLLSKRSSERKSACIRRGNASNTPNADVQIGTERAAPGRLFSLRFEFQLEQDFRGIARFDGTRLVNWYF